MEKEAQKNFKSVLGQYYKISENTNLKKYTKGNETNQRR